MDVDLILKIAGIGLIVAVINLLLAKSGRDEQALMTTLAGIVVVLLMLIPQMGGLINTIKDLFGL